MFRTGVFRWINGAAEVAPFQIIVVTVFRNAY